MEGRPSVARRGRGRTVGVLMAAVAASALACALIRPFATPVTIRAAEGILDAYGPKLGPGFDRRNYRVNSVSRTPSGYWLVHFTRIAGDGPHDHKVLVSDRFVRQIRLGMLTGVNPLKLTP